MIFVEKCHHIIDRISVSLSALAQGPLTSICSGRWLDDVAAANQGENRSQTTDIREDKYEADFAQVTLDTPWCSSRIWASKRDKRRSRLL
jgi:hypothetical protein